MHSQPDWQPTVTDLSHSQRFARDAYRALLVEVNLTPKPGGCRSPQQRRASRHGYWPFLSQLKGDWPVATLFYPPGYGRRRFALPSSSLHACRPLGMACEEQMFRATGGINTHKGSVFSLGLLCCALGRLQQQQRQIDAQSLCDEVAQMCRGVG
ncbi:triphosphoribosyl-dephospho-CoA synthase [Serratia fonticola]|uniref:2-(5''-triphosphoribosyl)-3'-dephosphocoenzyme-A synthase n=1 Tax=Serratia fonticola TaxID=47917 RepID=A0A4V6KMF9_SERFO|nr:triphosphoribosyl-dephospho-CoA synthase [Serratia fonticola]